MEPPTSDRAGLDEAVLAALRALPAGEPVDAAAAQRARGRAGGPPAGTLAVLAGWLGGVRAQPAAPLSRAALVVTESERTDRSPGHLAERLAGHPALPAGLTEPGALTATVLAAGGECADPLAAGLDLADRCIDAGADLLVLAGREPAAGALAAVALVGSHGPAEVVDRGAVPDDAAWMARTAAVRDAMRRLRPYDGDPAAMLAGAGDPVLVALVGLLRRCASRRTPVVLDPGLPYLAAMLASRGAREAAQWWLPASTSPDPADRSALARLPEQPALTLERRGGDGVAAVLALGHLQAAAALIRDPAPAPAGSPPAEAGDRPVLWTGM